MKNFLKNYGFIIFFVFVLVGLLDFRIALIATICMIGPIIFAILGKGRFWCGNICPRGNFYDKIVSKISNKKSTPKFLKSKIFRLVVILFMFYMFGIGIYSNFNSLKGIGMVFYRMIVVTSFIGIVLSIVYNKRIWCNFCPMGSIAAFISYFRKDRKKLYLQNTCVGCKVCEKSCPMNIDITSYKNDFINDVDCIQCGVCINKCPKNAINQ